MSAPAHLPPSAQKALESAAYHLFSTKYYALAATVILIYDTIITIDREVDVVWHSRWSGVKVLYFFNRYANIGVYIISWVAINSDWPTDICHRYVLFPGIFNLVQQVAIGAILCLYVFALCHGSKPITSFVFLVFIAQIVVIGWSLGAVTSVPLRPPLVGCIYSGKKGTGIRVITSWIMQLVFITIGFGVMFWKATQLRKDQAMTPMISFMTRDGLKYFAVIFAINFINVMNFSFVKARDLKSIHATFSAILTVVAINRLILGIRKEATRSTFGWGSDSRIPNHSCPTQATDIGSMAFIRSVTVVEEHSL